MNLETGASNEQHLTKQLQNNSQRHYAHAAAFTNNGQEVVKIRLNLELDLSRRTNFNLKFNGFKLRTVYKHEHLF